MIGSWISGGRVGKEVKLTSDWLPAQFFCTAFVSEKYMLVHVHVKPWWYARDGLLMIMNDLITVQFEKAYINNSY